MLIRIAKINYSFLKIKRMKRIFYVFIFFFIALLSKAQNIEFEKDNFPGKKDELREARKQLDIGLEFFMQGKKEQEDFKRYYASEHRFLPVSRYDFMDAGGENFRQAIAPLGTAQKFNPNNARLNYALGVVLFNIDHISDAALKHFEKANQLNPEIEFDLPYYLGWANHLQSRWDEAIKYYQMYLTKINGKGKFAMDVDDVNKKISECNVGKELSAKPERVFVDNLGPNVNSSFAEYGPVITTDESTIIFTARRDNSTGGMKDERNSFFEDIYISTKQNGKWIPSKHLSKNINSSEHDATAGLSSDGSKLYVYRYQKKDGGDLYESTLFGADWEVPEHMNKNINSKYHESTVSQSFDGRRIYFISDKDNGTGDRDIYFSELDVKGEWGPSKNVGIELNTKYAEEGVFIHPDGKTIYFSSKGHKSMGGFDIFKSTWENGKWSTPQNLGYPINGPDDDVFFVVSGSGKRAYFASAKQGGYGEKDLYKITFLGPEKKPLLSTQDQLLAMVANPVNNLKAEASVETKSAKLTVLKGVITDAKTNQPLEAMIDLIDNDANLVLATFKSNSASGKYLVTLPSGKNYGIAVKKESYLFHSENFNIPEGADYQEYNKDVALKKIEVGSTIVLRNIFFDFDKATIRPESANELDRLIKLLNDNPTLKIELGSHTDSKGSDDYNLKLSDSRSKSVVEYLITKGISASRLVAKGYGETKPMDTNDTDAGRQNNRRTEFKILEK
jgi:outer membrane protein OmpA-like peptidoglycan-associated protein